MSSIETPSVISWERLDVVFYHKNCSDGLLAAYLIKKINKNVIIYPITYDTTLDEILFREFKRCLFVDICLELELMIQIQTEMTFCSVIDHHPSKRDVVNQMGGFYSDSMAACMMVFQLLQPLMQWTTYQRDIVKIVSDYDCGKITERDKENPNYSTIMKLGFDDLALSHGFDQFSTFFDTPFQFSFEKQYEDFMEPEQFIQIRGAGTIIWQENMKKLTEISLSSSVPISTETFHGIVIEESKIKPKKYQGTLDTTDITTIFKLLSQQQQEKTIPPFDFFCFISNGQYTQQQQQQQLLEKNKAYLRSDGLKFNCFEFVNENKTEFEKSGGHKYAAVMSSDSFFKKMMP